MVEFDVLVNALLANGLVEVLEDEVGLGNGSVLLPWLPGEAEGVEIRVRAEACIS